MQILKKTAATPGMIQIATRNANAPRHLKRPRGSSGRTSIANVSGTGSQNDGSSVANSTNIVDQLSAAHDPNGSVSGHTINVEVPSAAQEPNASVKVLCRRVSPSRGVYGTASTMWTGWRHGGEVHGV
ncbi:hypothetical protein NX059_010377 [Plenodomus lindquistii]|nr:hypothetical protein NX059_010377 [Plenodomus lindquistii]